MTARRDHGAVQGQRPRRADRRAPAGRARPCAQFHRPARGRRRAAAGVRGAARQRARHQGPHARPSRPLSRGLRAQGRRERRPCPLRARTPRKRAGSSSTSAKSMGAKSVTKGKSMISEEIGLNQALEAAGIEAVETDLGEYIIQLRGETPSHIIAPAIHVTKAGRRAGVSQGAPRPAAEPRSRRARAIARPRRAACCAPSSSPPTSASPARISSSPRPGRRSSSPTRATAI